MIEHIDEYYFDNHKVISFICDKTAGLRGYVAIHRGSQYSPAFGATRFWNYLSEKEAITDVLKLSKLMTYKSLLAGYNYGGSKVAIIIDKSHSTDRKKLLNAYAHIVNCFRGAFITGADVGIDQDDLLFLAQQSSYFMGINSDPVSYTIDGVYACIPTCLEEVFGSTSLNKRSIAIQGLGKIGYGLLEKLYPTGIKIYASDINHNVLSKVTELYPNVSIVPSDHISAMDVDIFSPCALSGAINVMNISHLQCKIIVGSANCQLQSDSLGDQLHKRNILYAPDYIVNAGGLMGVIEEYEHGTCENEQISKKIIEIPKTLKIIFEQSKREHQSTVSVANNMALERMKNI